MSAIQEAFYKTAVALRDALSKAFEKEGFSQDLKDRLYNHINEHMRELADEIETSKKRLKKGVAA